MSNSIAQDLRAAINILDPERPLDTPERLANYYVSRPLSPLEELKMLLEDTDDPQKVLFTGHRGSGKTTELAKLVQELDDSFMVMHYSVKSILNLFDLSYVDVVLSLGLELFKRATAENIPVNQVLLESILDFTKEITRDVETGVKDQAEVGVSLNLHVVKLSSKLATEDATREIVREKVSRRLSDLLENIELLSREVERHTGKRLLMVVEDLDKTDLDTATNLFYKHANSLLAPPVSVIYTFPIAMRHHNDFMQIEMNFPNLYILPNLKVRDRAGKPSEEGVDCLRRILTCRVTEGLFRDGALEALAALSGGIPRELIVLARQASLEARGAGLESLEVAEIERAAQRKRTDYQLLLTSEQLRLLQLVQRHKRVENDTEHRALLHNLSALEYRNSGVWYDVHPLVEALLEDE
ncbi:MAG: hypothetical protein GKR89_12095 [Candidatus Latescibacteria bacterium]|nr:hypothetical protein [Candidatus Latescibacterota bacterium]